MEQVSIITIYLKKNNDGRVFICKEKWNEIHRNSTRPFFCLYIIDKNPGNYKFYTAGDGRLPYFPKVIPSRDCANY